MYDSHGAAANEVRSYGFLRVVECKSPEHMARHRRIHPGLRAVSFRSHITSVAPRHPRAAKLPDQSLFGGKYSTISTSSAKKARAGIEVPRSPFRMTHALQLMLYREPVGMKPNASQRFNLPTVFSSSRETTPD